MLLDPVIQLDGNDPSYMLVKICGFVRLFVCVCVGVALALPFTHTVATLHSRGKISEQRLFIEAFSPQLQIRSTAIVI